MNSIIIAKNPVIVRITFVNYNEPYEVPIEDYTDIAVRSDVAFSDKLPELIEKRILPKGCEIIKMEFKAGFDGRYEWEVDAKGEMKIKKMGG